MRKILLGEPGSGKTAQILQAVRQRLQTGRCDFRLVTPTSTMSEHFRHLLAREGLLVRPKTIVTIAGLVRELAPEQQAISTADLEWMIAALLAERRPRALAGLWESAGLRRALARVFDELSNAACGALQWRALGDLRVWSSDVLTELGEIYSCVEDRMARRNLVFRAGQVIAAASAASRLRESGVTQVWFDGFFSLTLAERQLARTLAAHVSVTVTLPEWPGARQTLEDLQRKGFRVDRLYPRRAVARKVAVPCSDSDSAATELARRIRKLKDSGIPWREIAVVMRQAGPDAAMLETTFSRFGIPVRLYFGEPLPAHPVCQLLSAAVLAVLSNFDHEIALRALASPTGLAGLLPGRDQFDFSVRNQLPGQGLPDLYRLASIGRGNAPLLRMIEVLEKVEADARQSRPPADWIPVLARLETLVAEPVFDRRVNAEALRVWRRRSSALQGFRAALAQAADLLGSEPASLEAFWRGAEVCLDAVTLHPQQQDREAVALLDAQEARQWEVPYVFLWGLLEGEFPRTPRAGSILDEQVRLRLVQAGVPVTLLRDCEDQENFLFQVALSRATRELVLAYPIRDAKGDPTLPSFELSRLAVETEQPVLVRLLGGVEPEPVPAVQSISAASLLARIRETHASLKATSIESFLQCPYQFHARYTLVLKGPPPRPSERFNLARQGMLLHSVVSRWHRGEGDPHVLFDEEWGKSIRKHKVAAGFRAAAAELELRRSLDAYLLNNQPLPGWSVLTEQPFQLELETFVIRGRIDRYDTSSEKRCRVYDLKYTGEKGAQKRVQQAQAGLFLQGGLYVLGLEAQGLEVESFSLVAVRGGHAVEVWEGARLAELRTIARTTAQEAAESLFSGVILPSPANPRACENCDFIDTCRIREIQRATVLTARSAT